ncbi:MAG: family 20 glycosylhydrolase [bacterium]
MTRRLQMRVRLSAALCLRGFGCAGRSAAETVLPSVIPWPRAMTVSEGSVALSSAGRIVAEDAGLAPLADVFAREIYLSTAVNLATVAAGAAGADDIVLRLTDTVTSDEGYRLTAGPAGIVVEARTCRGAAWGTSTLLQSIQRDGPNPPRIPFMTVADEPAAPYRGLLIDVARQWHPVEKMRPLIDLCRLYKIKYLQLHLNDQQSTVFPFLAYPELASVVSGQRRTWTRDEVTNLVRYADERGVTLVPELEGPGHHAGNLRNLWGRGSTLDIFNENTYTGMRALIGELCEVFASSPYIHIGADEGSFGHLGSSTNELEYMAAHGLTGNALGHYITRVDQIVKDYGKHTICWEGFGGDGGGKGVEPLPKDIAVMPFESTYNPANQLVAKGFSVINTAWRPMYVVGSKCWSAEFIYGWNMWLWQHHVNLNLYIQLPPTNAVLGAQMCAWEQTADVELPSTRVRLHAMGERTWSPDGTNTHSCADFAARAEKTDALLDRVLALVDVQADGVSGVESHGYELFDTNLVIRLSAPAIGTIRYTLDGTPPTAASPQYAGPLVLAGANAHFENLFYNSRTGNYEAQGYIANLQARIIDPSGQPVGDVITLRHYWYKGAEIDVAAAGLSGYAVGEAELFRDALSVILTPSGPGVIRYTLNGGEPTASSPAYSEPLLLTASNCVVQGINWNRARAQYDLQAPVVILRAHLFSPTGTALSGLTAKAVYWNMSHALAQPDLAAPSVPSNVTATVSSSRSVRLAWSASIDNLGMAGYDVYRDAALIASVAETAFTDTGLTGGTTYRYTVRARDVLDNVSEDSVPVDATTFPLPNPGGSLLAQESFDYAEGANVSGLDGGTGWGGPWVVGCSSSFPATVELGSLEYAGVGAVGRHMKFWTKGNGTTFENLDRPFAASVLDQGQVIWFAMTVALYDCKDASTWTLAGLTTDANGLTNATLFSTAAGAAPSPFKLGSDTLFTGDTNMTPHLVLVRIGMSGNANAENVTVYADPDLGADAGTWAGYSRALYANGGLTGFVSRGGRNGSSMVAEVHMDEIRIADGWQVAIGQAVTPPDNVPPTVAIIAPVNGATCDASGQIAISANAADSDGTVTGVTFFQGAVKLGEAFSAPYGCVWSNVPAGSYTLTAKATDDDGTVTTAAAVSITVASPPTGGVATVEESFDYPEAANLSGLNGGRGWKSPWVVGTHASYPAVVLSGPLGDRAGLIPSGNHLKFWAKSNGSVYLSLSREWAARIADEGQTVWFAMTVAFYDAKEASSWTLTGLSTNAESSVGGELFRLRASTTAVPAAGLLFNGTLLFTGDTSRTPHLLLVKIVLSGDTNAETLTAYADPDLTADSGTWSGVTKTVYANNGLTGFSYNSGRNSSSYASDIYMDEIRVAAIWQAAVGQPVAANPDANANGLPDSWETAYFGGTDNPLGAAGYDFDHDGMNNGDEYGAGTDPTNAASVLRLTEIGMPAGAELVLLWQSVSGKTYAVQSSTNLLAGFRDTADTNLVAIGGTMSRTVTVDQAAAGFYRVNVKP